MDWTFDAGSPAYVGVRWVWFVGLVGVAGSVAFRLLVLPRTRRRSTEADASLVKPAAHAASAVGIAMATLVLGAAIARLYAQSYSLFGPELAGALESWSAVLRTRWGQGWWIHVAAAGTALGGFLAARRGSGAGWGLAAIGALALGFNPALAGHALTAPGPTWVSVFADGVHVLAAGGWLGSLLLLVVVGIPAALRLEDGMRGPAVAALVQAFSPTALVFAGAVAGTGIFSAWLQVGDVEALWTTTYGRTLLLKVAMLSALFATGAYNFLRVRPALGDDAATRRLQRSATFELLVTAAVLLVTAVLVATPTPRDLS